MLTFIVVVILLVLLFIFWCMLKVASISDGESDIYNKK